MSSNTNQGSFCKTLCWGLGIAVGGYTAYALVVDFKLDQVQSGVLGVVTALLVGLILRRVLCRGHSNRLRKRLEETAAQSEVEARAVMASATAKVAAAKEVAKTGGDPKPARIKVKAKDKIKAELKAEGTAATPAIKAPEADKSTTAFEPDIAPNMPPEPEINAPLNLLKLHPILEVAPDLPVEKDGDEAEKLLISGDYDESEISEATKAAIADIAPVIAPDVTVSAADELADSVELEPKTPNEANPVVMADAPPKIKPLEPTGLSAPENGAPDALEQIDGIEADQVAALNKAGIYHFTQFVSMNRRELAWLDENIPGGGDDAAGAWRKQAIQLSRKAG